MGANDNVIRLPPRYETFLPPVVGGSYTDPVFGVSIKRLSDAANMTNNADVGLLPFVSAEYSTASPFNSDNSRLILQHHSYFGLYDEDGNYLRDLPFAVNASAEPRWSRSDPNVLYYVSGNTLMKLDVLAETSLPVHSFSEYSAIRGRGESNISQDGDHFVFAADQPPGLETPAVANRYVFVYEISTDTKGPVLDTLGHAFDNLYIAPTNSVAIGWTSSGSDRFTGIELFDRNMTFERQLTHTIGHMHLTRDTNGDDVLIWTNSNDPDPIPNCENGIVKVRLSDAQQTCLFELDWSLAVHISAADDNGWAFVGTYAPGDPPPAAPGWALYTNEILQVKLDGTEIRRLLHHRSRPVGSDNVYSYQPRAAVSRDGTRLVFTSNYSLQTILGAPGEFTDAYFVAVPALVPPRVLINDASVVEGNSGQAELAFSVTLSHASDLSVSVEYATGDGTATSPSDYAATTGTLTFAPGETTKSIVVLANADATAEMDETFSVNLSNGTNAVIDDDQGVGTIEDDDPAPPVQWTDVVGAAASGGSLTKTAAAGSWNAGGVSTKQLSSGDGFVEFAISGVAMAGLGSGDTDRGYIDLEHAAFVGTDGQIRVYESGVLRGVFGPYAPNDRLRVGIEGGVVKYRRNGTQFYTSLVPPAGKYPWRLDTTLYSAGAQIQGATIQGTFVPPVAPVSNPGGPYTGGVGIPVRFAGSGSSDPDGAIVSYAWTFGDGGTGTGASPTRLYASAGMYTVTLTVTDADGLTHGVSTSATISLVESIAWTNVVGATASGSSLTKTAAAGIWNAGGVSTRRLASGDGLVEFVISGVAMAGLGSGDTDQGYIDLEHAAFVGGDSQIRVYESGVLRGVFGPYAPNDRLRVGIEGGVVKYRRNGTVFYTSLVPPAGKYPWRLDTTLYSAGAQVQGATIQGTFVPPVAPVSNAGGPYTGGVGIAVQFAGGGSSDSDGAIVSYAWTFGDGGTGTGASPTHPYGSAGTYTVTLTVTDTDGLTQSASTTATITLVESVAWTNVVGATASGSNLTKTAVGGTWNTGGVSTRRLASGDGFVEFAISGVAMAGLGSGDTDQGYIDLEHAAFVGGDSQIRVYESGVLRGVFGPYAPNDRLRVGIEGGVVKYRRNGTVFYTSLVPPAGKYPWRLDTTLYSAGAQVQGATIQGTFVPPVAPVSNAGGPYTGGVGTTVQFAGSGSSDPDGVIVSYAWTFGDGGTGTGASPTHPYASAGTYTVTLTVTDTDGLTHSASTTATISLVESIAWTNVVGATASGSSLTKTAAAGIWNAGGVSTRRLASGDGLVEFVISGVAMAGLGSGDTDQGYIDLEHAAFVGGDSQIRVYESGVLRGVFGAYAPNDRLRVGIEGGVVKYRRNGTVFYTSLVSPGGKYPWRLDTTLYSAGAQVQGATIQGTFLP